MAKDGRTRNANSFERFMEDVGLGFRCPDRATGAIAVTKTGPVKDDDPVSLGRSFDKAARREILDHTRVTMQQNQRLAVTLFDVMEPEAPHINKLPNGRVVALCPFGNEAVDKR
jgi:hypothetical protein